MAHGPCEHNSRVERSAVMRRVKSRDTAPELRVRRAAHALGYRFRLYDARLLGRPDLVFAARRKLVFVHGCFWHWHDCPRGRRAPKTNEAYWRSKIGRNVERDAEHLLALAGQGWGVLVIWECETKNPEELRARLRGFLGPSAREAREARGIV